MRLCHDVHPGSTIPVSEERMIGLVIRSFVHHQIQTGQVTFLHSDEGYTELVRRSLERIRILQPSFYVGAGIVIQQAKLSPRLPAAPVRVPW